ncbi:Partner of Y14 and mago [Glycine soja]|uniref:Partner of Y14 and mago n=1 Tax=Glycine soja TaxID=3848 RepID=A0A0B2R253_GLYSO|nr:Partner of Y14 and mago [Glycine soja]
MSDEERTKQIAELSKSLKEGERIVGPTRRPDGTLRKPIRIRAGYTPQDEVAIYQPKGALEPDADSKPKTKSVKRNEIKKEKCIQAALEKEKNVSEVEDSGKQESLEALTSQVNRLALQDSPQAQDIDKRIRALKKKGNVEHISIPSDAKNLVTSDFEGKHLQVWKCDLNSGSLCKDQHEAAEGVLLDDDLNEPTMGEKLASLSVLDGNKSRSDIEQESSVPTKPPSADSVHVLLKQALNADDRTLLLDCLFTQNEKVLFLSYFY